MCEYVYTWWLNYSQLLCSLPFPYSFVYGICGRLHVDFVLLRIRLIMILAFISLLNVHMGMYASVCTCSMCRSVCGLGFLPLFMLIFLVLYFSWFSWFSYFFLFCMLCFRFWIIGYIFQNSLFVNFAVECIWIMWSNVL